MIFRVLYTDIIKYRKSLVFWINLAYPIFSVLLVFLVYFGMNPIPDRPVFEFSRSLMLVSSFFLPFYLILLITQVNFTENRIQGWKLLYAQPLPKSMFFISKILVFLFSCIFVFLLIYLLAIASLKILPLHNPEYVINNIKQGLRPAFSQLGKVYLSAFLMMAIQYYLSLRFRNFILPLGIGVSAAILPIAIFITLGIAGIIQNEDLLAGILRYDPYTLPYSFVFDFDALSNPDFMGDIPTIFIIASVGIGLLVYYLAYVDQVHRNIK